ncbi:hypothetical protein CLV34_2339 [Luteimicrobium subarcticum]|uniref:Uncharacterized protein n=1 Tax=Luteimicrobium subarcticum TaxID=620910 RepID=A0A2M8WJH0_9MICO|nr:hypothetical protein CLV34_2339 [Luteimicrobium subarcticum]
MIRGAVAPAMNRLGLAGHVHRLGVPRNIRTTGFANPFRSSIG